MTKDDLARRIAAEYDLTAAGSKNIVSSVFEHIGTAMEAGEKADIHGFGHFFSKATKQRNGVNPKTGARLVIAASRLPGFKAAKALKDLIKATA